MYLILATDNIPYILYWTVGIVISIWMHLDSFSWQMVMYTHQFGGVSGGLSVLVAERQIYPVWERGGSLGDLWVKAEIEFVVNSTFQVHVFSFFSILTIRINQAATL